MKPVVLVVGGAGYVGSHTCAALADAGYVPVTLDDLSTGYEDAVRFGPFVRGDVRDADTLDAAMTEHAPVAVLHFAALSLVGESVADPVRYWRDNVLGAAELVAACVRHGVRSFVFSSSAAVYGTPASVPIPETAPLLPVNPYGRTKRAVEELLEDAHAAHGLRSFRLRYFNAAGAEPARGLAERHEPETHLIPLVLQVATGDREHIAMFGTDYPTPDGTCVRDYVHVADLADAHVAALRALLDGHAGGALNLGTGRGASVREVIEVARDVTGHPIPAVEAPRRAGDPAALVADPGRAGTELGWVPTRSDLRSMVADAWAAAQGAT